MSENLRIRIDDDDAPAPSVSREDDAARADAEAERARHAEAEVVAARRELLQSRRQEAAATATNIAAQIDLAEAALVQAHENGDWSNIAKRQRDLTTLEIRRSNVEAASSQLERVAALPADPVEAYLAQCTPATARWMREHPADAHVLATNSDPRRARKLLAAHNDALGDGVKVDTPEYFSHVERFLGRGDGAGQQQRHGGGRTEAPQTRKIRVLAQGKAASGPDEMTRGEYVAATETLTWSHDDPGGRFKKGEPLGLREYLRRRDEMRKTPGWYDRLD